MYENESRSRRTFLKQSGLVLLGSGMVNSNRHSYASDSAEKPILACRDHHLKEVSAPDSWNAVKKIGAGGVEVNVAWDDKTKKMVCPNLYPAQKLYSITTPEEIKILQADLQKNEVAITAFCMNNQFDLRPDAEYQWAALVVQACRILKVKAIRIDFIPHKLQGEEFVKFAVAMGKRLADLVKDTKIRFGIENHSNTTNRPEFLDQLFDGIGSEAIGLTLDTANFYWFGHPLDTLYKIFEKYAFRIYHTHCKSIRYPENQRNANRPMGWEYEKYTCPIYAGDIDFQKVYDILRKANYPGDLCIENESLRRFPENQREDILKKEIDFLKKVVGA